MRSYITEKYAGMLTEEDVENLFASLSKSLGDNRSEAARRCGLTGKATYDWKGAAYVKLGTKEKVLEASLNQNFLYTVEYLLSRSSDRSLDLLRTILSTLYANALETASTDELRAILAKFEATRKAHRGLIRDGIQDEVADLSLNLKNKASESGIQPPAKGLDDFSAGDVINAVQLIGHIYAENPIQAKEFAKKEISLPEEAFQPVIQTFENLCFTGKTKTTTVAVALHRTGVGWRAFSHPELSLKDEYCQPFPFPQDDAEQVVTVILKGGPQIHEITTRS